MLVPIRIAEDVVDEIQDMYDQITRRAYEIFLDRGGIGTLDLEDWLTAEQQRLFKPEVHLEENGGLITVTICIGEAWPMDVEVIVTPGAMLIQAESRIAAKKIFRTVEFPRRIDVTKAEARFTNGCLVLTATHSPLLVRRGGRDIKKMPRSLL